MYGLVGVTGHSIQVEELRVQALLQVAVTPRHGGGAAAVVVAGTVRVVGNDSRGVLCTEVLDGHCKMKTLRLAQKM